LRAPAVAGDVQIVGYESAVGGEDDRARLLLADGGTVESAWLGAGRELDYSLGERHCAGALEYGGEEIRHTACGAESAPYCETHTSRWACARCTGNCDLPLESCREEHAVYLAAFAPATFKIGVTRSWRLDTRLREQGADRAAHLRTVSDGRIARRIEADIAAEIGDRVRVPRKIEGLHLPVDEVAWERLLADYDPLATYEFAYGFDLAERPMAETLATGTVRGVQGRVLVLDRNGSTYAVDMRDLVGHEVTAGGTDRALQSSFSAFE
jgi:hypothetical protein